MAAPWDDRNHGVKHFEKLFAYEHLPEHLQAISKPVGELAVEMVKALPDGQELAAGLRKLMEAKDCFVRAAL
jgi:hypothetical protein